MNEKHLLQIFQNYIDHFDEDINKKHAEYYKWKVALKYRELMDSALDGPVEEFATRLTVVKNCSKNLIDSYTTPFHGLVRYARKDINSANEVKDMFMNLLRGGTYEVSSIQERVDTFLSKSLEIRDREYPGSHMYKNDMHSVTGYLFLYDPDHSYFFKASHARAFAQCIEFADDWGSGVNVKLSVYYRMCDWLVEQIKKNEALLVTNESRYQNLWDNPTEEMHPDTEKHILAFDIIYCCANYDLYQGITLKKMTLKERQVLQERKKKAKEAYEALVKAREDNEKLEEAMDYINSVCVPGTNVKSLMHGNGIVKANESGNSLRIEFEKKGEKLLGTATVFANGIITLDSDVFSERINSYKDVLKHYNYISKRLESAEEQFEPYSEYLD